MKAICRGCNGERGKGKYLCLNCWDLLPPATRTALKKTDVLAVRRAAQMYDQLGNDRDLRDIEVTP